MTLGFPIPLGFPIAIGTPPGGGEPPEPPVRRFVVPGAARRVILSSRPQVAPQMAEARPGPVLVE